MPKYNQGSKMKDEYKNCKCGLTKFKFKIANLKVGDRVIGIGIDSGAYTGVIKYINFNVKKGIEMATIKRDDLLTGSGNWIEDYGHGGWASYKNKGYWMSDYYGGSFLQEENCKRCQKIINVKR